MLWCVLYLTLLFPWAVDLAWGRQVRENNSPWVMRENASLLSVGQIFPAVFEEAYSGGWDYSSDGLKERLTTWNHEVINEDMGAFDPQLSVRPGLSRWRTPVVPAPFSLFPDHPAGQSGVGVEYPVLVQDAPDVSEPGNTTPSALRRDWRGLGRDTVFFLGYQMVAIGITYLLPEDVSRWTEEQKNVTLERWWENVQHPVWDEDHWYVNYIGHPYFGAVYYIRARERGFGAFGSFWYAAFLSGLYEFGIEALFEQPSYQDLIVTPVGGALLGAFIFEPLRQRIKSKPERQWYDHLGLILTDPLGAANSIFERVLGLKAEMRIQFRPPALASHEPSNARLARTLTRQGEPPQRSHGASIEFIFNGKEKSARRSQ